MLGDFAEELLAAMSVSSAMAGRINNRFMGLSCEVVNLPQDKEIGCFAQILSVLEKYHVGTGDAGRFNKKPCKRRGNNSYHAVLVGSVNPKRSAVICQTPMQVTE